MRHVIFTFFVGLSLCKAAFAQASTEVDPSKDTTKDTTSRVFQLLLPNEHLLGDLGGLRPKLEELGISPRLFVITDAAGNPKGGLSQGGTQASSAELSLLFNLDRIVGLKHGSLFVSMSQRWGTRLSTRYIGNVFPAQQVYGFETFRIIDFSYQQQLLRDRVELRLGRFAQTDDFLVSPYNFAFVSNAFCGNPFGILLDAPGVQAYTGTWGALGKVKPTKRTQVMAGVYDGDKAERENKHHGLDLSVRGPVFVIGEVSYIANGMQGDSQRLGNYKLGAWFDHSKLTDFETNASKIGSWGAYALFDQVITPFGDPSDNRGFGIFGSVTVAPDTHVQEVPLYFTAGVSARGVLDKRPLDTVSFGVASGYFSDALQRGQKNGSLVPPEGGVQTQETVTELTYRFALRKSALLVQPDVQYIIRPGGTGHLSNTLILGAQFGVTF